MGGFGAVRESTEYAPIAVALDAPDAPTLATWVSDVATVVQCVKVGLESFCRDGHASVDIARESARKSGREDIDIFLDLKLHDIPATVGGAACSIASLRPTYLTVHASGGAEMIEAAVRAVPKTRVTAVTLLTSLDSAAVAELGFGGSPADIVVRWAHVAVEAGARALVCSPQEVAMLRAVVPADIHLITPGVRPAGSEVHDQRRAATPARALADGADLLVIGRPITSQDDVRAAARALANECRA